MNDSISPDFGSTDVVAPEPSPAAPTLLDSLIKGEWSRNLVLPDHRGNLRLTRVKTVRGLRESTAPGDQLRFIDANRRHSA